MASSLGLISKDTTSGTFKMDPVKKYRLFLTAMCANLGSFSVGVYIGWTSPVMPKLRNHSEDSPLGTGISTSEEGWISSLTAVGACIGALSVGYFAARFGRKRTLLSSSIFFVTSYILLMVAHKIWIIYAARLIQGLGGGVVTALTSMYIGEIATDDLRGALGSLILLFMSSGILFSYCIGPFVSYMTLQWCCMSIPMLHLVTFSFMPESPYFYAIKNQTSNGIRSLQQLRGQSQKTVEVVMDRIQKNVNDQMLQKSKVVDIFRNPAYRKALLIGCGLLLFQQFSGTKVIALNSQSIFTSANSSLDPAIATIILGCCQLISNFVTPFVVEKAGRKMVLMISSCGTCLAHITLGTFFYVQEFGDASKMLWLPVPVLICFNVFYGFGFGPVPWAVLGEMFPSNIKSKATSMACATTWLTSFVVVRWFPELNALGPFYAFWFFGGMCGVAFLFVFFVVIETKGMSLQSIQDKLHA